MVPKKKLKKLKNGDIYNGIIIYCTMMIAVKDFLLKALLLISQAYTKSATLRQSPFI